MIPRISIFSVVVVVIVCLILLSSTEQGVTAAKASSHHSAAVPKSKSAKSSGFKGVLGGSLIKNFMREAKMSFCSELEGLTLQISRPSNALVPLGLLEELANFVALEYDNPEMLVSVLVKLSRKFAESNAYTQVKTTLSLHQVMQKVEDKVRVEWAKAILSMMKERDEKTGNQFFDVLFIEEASASAESAEELQTVALERLYVEYTVDYLHARSHKMPIAVKAVSKLVSLVELIRDIESLATKINSPLTKQIMDVLAEDKKWAVQTLMEVYENGSISSDTNLQTELASLLKQEGVKAKESTKKDGENLDASSSSSQKTMLSSVPASTSTSIRATTAVPASPGSKPRDISSSPLYKQLKSDVERSVGLPTKVSERAAEDAASGEDEGNAIDGSASHSGKTPLSTSTSSASSTHVESESESANISDSTISIAAGVTAPITKPSVSPDRKSFQKPPSNANQTKILGKSAPKPKVSTKVAQSSVKPSSKAGASTKKPQKVPKKSSSSTSKSKKSKTGKSSGSNKQ